MTTVQPWQTGTAFIGDPGYADHTVLARRGDGLVLHPVRRRDELIARLRSQVLDGRLSAGVPAEADLLLAVRAQQLVRPRYRRRLARDWDEVAARACAPLRPFDVRVPVDRARLAAATPEMEEVSEVLRSVRMVSARGVALASGLLTSARSPLYRCGASAPDLVAAVARALVEL